MGQLTEERARNIQKARMNGETQRNRLEGKWPKNEEGHGIRIAYQVFCNFTTYLQAK